MLVVLLTLLYVIVSVFLILVVLLQTGKRADLAGAFGGGGSQTAFGARGAATVLTKATTGAAILFMVTALALSIVHSRKSGQAGSVLDEVDPAAAAEPAPAVPPPMEGAPGEGMLAGSAPVEDEMPADVPPVSDDDSDATPPGEDQP